MRTRPGGGGFEGDLWANQWLRGPKASAAAFLSASLVGSRGCGGAAAGWTAG